MATEVPYTGVPTTSPRFEPTPDMSINTPPAAFGVNVAEALGHLGQVQEGAGKELFDRAYAMQELHVQAQVNSAVSDAQNQMMGKYLDYTQLEGKAAVDGYQPFLNDLDKIRDDVGKSVDNPFGQVLYNNESRNSRFRLAFSGGVHAKDQNKQYVIGSSQALIKSAENAAELDPNNEATYRSGLDTVKGEFNHLADVGGLPADDPKRKEMVAEGVSDYILKHIRGMAKNDPLGAQKLLDRAISDKDVVGDKVDQVSAYVRSQQLTIGTRHGASEVLSGKDLSYGDKIVSPEQSVIGIKAIEGGNYRAIGKEVPRKNGQGTDHALGAYQVMGDNLQGWLREANNAGVPGMGPMTEQEFLNDKGAQDRLFQFKFGQYMEKYGSFNKAASAWFTGKPNAALTASDGITTLQGYLTVANRAMARNAPLADKVAAGQAYAQRVAPGDDEFADRMEQQIEILHNNNERILKDTENNNKQTVYGAIVNGGEGGKVPTTVEELKAVSPDVGQAWDNLDPTEQRNVMRVLATNAKGDVSWNDDRLARYQNLVGEAVNHPDEFLKEDLIGQDLPMRARKELIDMQQKVYKKTDAAPNTAHALSVLKDTLTATGLPEDKENMALFTGILHDTIQQFQKENDRPPNDDEINIIGHRLLRQTGGSWWSNGTPWFESQPPQEWLDKAKALPDWKILGIDPDDHMLQKMYIQQQYQYLFGKKASTPGEK
jgi:hypothetical protein